MENKYKDWSKVLLEPATMNDARVFALESRLENSEDMRIKEFDFLKDLMRKLVFSIEQQSLSHLDTKQEGILPTLLSN